MLSHLFLLLKSHEDLHGKIGVRLNFFVFFIDDSMETPIATTRTIPEFNEIVVTSFKEFPEFVRDGY